MKKALLLGALSCILGVIVYLAIYTLASLLVLYAADVLLGTTICNFNSSLFGAIVLFVIKLLFGSSKGE